MATNENTLGSFVGALGEQREAIEKALKALMQMYMLQERQQILSILEQAFHGFDRQAFAVITKLAQSYLNNEPFPDFVARNPDILAVKVPLSAEVPEAITKTIAAILELARSNPDAIPALPVASPTSETKQLPAETDQMIDADPMAWVLGRRTWMTKGGQVVTTLAELIPAVSSTIGPSRRREAIKNCKNDLKISMLGREQVADSKGLKPREQVIAIDDAQLVIQKLIEDGNSRFILK